MKSLQIKQSSNNSNLISLTDYIYDFDTSNTFIKTYDEDFRTPKFKKHNNTFFDISTELYKFMTPLTLKNGINDDLSKDEKADVKEFCYRHKLKLFKKFCKQMHIDLSSYKNGNEYLFDEFEALFIYFFFTAEETKKSGFYSRIFRGINDNEDRISEDYFKWEFIYYYYKPKTYEEVDYLLNAIWAHNYKSEAAS